MYPNRPYLAAPVGGFAAFVMAKVLEDALPTRLVGLQKHAEAGRLHPDRLTEVTQAWAAIREAAKQWADREAVAGGSTAEQLAAVPAGSSEIDTDRAAALLGVTPNRVRQLVRNGALPARKQARMWLVDRTSVELRKECNGGNFR